MLSMQKIPHFLTTWKPRLEVVYQKTRFRGPLCTWYEMLDFCRRLSQTANLSNLSLYHGPDIEFVQDKFMDNRE